jgi:hypothetical protein
VATGIKLYEFPDLNSVDFFVGLDEERRLKKRKVGRRDELFPRILDAAVSIKKREDQLRRTTRDLRTRVAECTEVDGGIYQHLAGTVTNRHFCATNVLFKY